MSDAKRYGCFSWESSGEGGQVSEIWAAKDGDLVRYSDYTALEAENRKLREALSGAENIIWTRCLKDGADTETWTPEERAALKLLLARIYE